MAWPRSTPDSNRAMTVQEANDRLDAYLGFATKSYFQQDLRYNPDRAISLHYFKTVANALNINYAIDRNTDNNRILIEKDLELLQMLEFRRFTFGIITGINDYKQLTVSTADKFGSKVAKGVRIRINADYTYPQGTSGAQYEVIKTWSAHPDLVDITPSGAFYKAYISSPNASSGLKYIRCTMSNGIGESVTKTYYVDIVESKQIIIEASTAVIAMGTSNPSAFGNNYSISNVSITKNTSGQSVNLTKYNKFLFTGVNVPEANTSYYLSDNFDYNNMPATIGLDISAFKNCYISISARGYRTIQRQLNFYVDLIPGTIVTGTYLSNTYYRMVNENNSEPGVNVGHFVSSVPETINPVVSNLEYNKYDKNNDLIFHFSKTSSSSMSMKDIEISVDFWADNYLTDYSNT